MSVTLARTVQRNLSMGEPLPDVFPSLHKAKIRFRRGNLHLVAGQPGSMKTAWVLALTRKLGVPTLYFSNDTDETTVAGRMLAGVTDQPTDMSVQYMKDAKDWASGKLGEYDNIRWVFDPGPTLEDLDLEMLAFEEIYGEFPHLVVVDILDNISYYEDSDHGAVAMKLKYLHTMARNTSSALLVVHHATEAIPGQPCPPRWAILGKQNKLPVLILTTAYFNGNFYLAPVKNRNGFQDVSGKSALQFRVDPETFNFTEM